MSDEYYFTLETDESLDEFNFMQNLCLNIVELRIFCERILEICRRSLYSHHEFGAELNG